MDIKIDTVEVHKKENLEEMKLEMVNSFSSISEESLNDLHCTFDNIRSSDQDSSSRVGSFLNPKMGKFSQFLDSKPALNRTCSTPKRCSIDDRTPNFRVI